MNKTIASSQTQPRRKSRLTGCLIALAIFALVIVLTLAFLSWMLFRVRPAIPEERFFAADMVAFIRLDLDSVNPGFRERAASLFPLSDAGFSSGPDAERMRKTLELALHPRHYLYVYQSSEPVPEFLLLFGLKRFHTAINLVLKSRSDKPSSSSDPRITRLSSIPGIKAPVYHLVFKSGESAYLAVAPSTILVSNSRRRLDDSLRILQNNPPFTPPGEKAAALLPVHQKGNLLTGFVLWNPEWTPVALEALEYALYDLPGEEAEKWAEAAKASFYGVTILGEFSGKDQLRVETSSLFTAEKDALLIEQYFSSFVLPHLKDIPDFYIRQSRNRNRITHEMTFDNLTEMISDR